MHCYLFCEAGSARRTHSRIAAAVAGADSGCKTKAMQNKPGARMVEVSDGLGDNAIGKQHDAQIRVPALAASWRFLFSRCAVLFDLSSSAPKAARLGYCPPEGRSV